jgi:single-strand DNA-binding protein
MSIPVNLTGRLTADPELRYAPTGTAVARFTVVTSRRVRDQQTGEWSDADTSYWDCVAFKQMAENVAESLTRGAAVMVTGKMAQRNWEDKEGQARKSFEVTVDEIGPSLRWVSAKLNRTSRDRPDAGDPSAREAARVAVGASPRDDDPWGSDAPPF